MVLNRLRSLATGRVFVVLLLLLFAGCGMLMLRDGDGLRTFRHDRHAAKGITCNACHLDVASGEVASMPFVGVCLVCHGKNEQRKSYPFEAELQKQGIEQSFVARERYYDLRFSHQVHTTAGVACVECHQDPDAAAGTVARHGADADACQSCHEQRSVSTSCEGCHKETRRDTRPPSHDQAAWIRLHGRELAYGHDLGHRESCGQCHTQSSCDGCHQVDKPQDHTEFFRQRGHGFRAGIERERCAACHQENFCVRCHESTAPRSHFAGSWGGSTSNHCVRCHEPLGALESSRCSVCHRSTPSHLTATRIPGPPHPAANADCYRCHLRPPHADNRMPCTVCHR